jgi:hypothetical protein
MVKVVFLDRMLIQNDEYYQSVEMRHPHLTLALSRRRLCNLNFCGEEGARAARKPWPRRSSSSRSSTSTSPCGGSPSTSRKPAKVWPPQFALPARAPRRRRRSSGERLFGCWSLQASSGRWCSCTGFRRYGTRGATRCSPSPPPGTAPSRRTGAGTGSPTSRRSRRRRSTTTSSRISSPSSTPSPCPRYVSSSV